MYEKNPNRIENGSFDIITHELAMDDVRLPEESADLIKRVIHTTADFEYAHLIKMHPDAIKVGKRAIKNGCTIYTDTRMIKYGLRSDRIGCKIVNYVHDEDVKVTAQKKGLTRSMVAIEKAAEEGIKIFAIGNAPTALFKLKELIEEGQLTPDLIIGVPVGFVGAVESKEAIKELNIPWIITEGRKGGSPIAVAMINALYKMGK